MIFRNASISHVALLVLMAVMSVSASGQGLCREDADCPGYNGNEFCEHVSCQSDGSCVQIPSPCSSSCFEEEQKCVECVEHDDCNESTNHCNEATHTCTECSIDEDCPDTKWCLGGHQICSDEGTCKDPPMEYWPCDDADQCIEEWQQCGPCKNNDDCPGGYGDFCTRRATCDIENGRCLERQAPCRQEDEVCDPQGETCVECLSDVDCLSDDMPFCRTLPYCNFETNECVSGEKVDYCGESADHFGLDTYPLTRCIEERRLCEPVLCDRDEDCEDDNPSSGPVFCQDSTCMHGKNDMAENHTSYNNVSVLGLSCGTPGAEDPTCIKGGYVCKRIGVEQTSNPNPQILYDCERCIADTECLHTDADTGRQHYASCDFDTGQCLWDEAAKRDAATDNKIGIFDAVNIHSPGWADRNMSWTPYNLSRICYIDENFTTSNFTQCLHNVSMLFNFTTNATDTTNTFSHDDRVNAVVLVVIIIVVAIIFILIGFLIRKENRKGNKKTKII